jgi:enoyl-CoA hydratase/carnithine racemase
VGAASGDPGANPTAGAESQGVRTDATPSSNGHGPDTWAGSWTHMRIDRRSAADCRVTFAHPPINAVTATTVAELAELVGLIEHDADLNAVVFDSGNPDFYLGQDDRDDGDEHAWRDVLARLSRAPVISIASIRGIVRGAGSEFVLACDLRFASRERTLVGRPGAGRGRVAGDDPTVRLSRLVGRARALELLLVPEDLDGDRAERYGYVNRAIADDRLDAEVDAMAARLARYDREALARTKSSV